jgi:hypothetical protein
MRRRRHPPTARDDHEAVVEGRPVLTVHDGNREAVVEALAAVFLAALAREGEQRLSLTPGTSDQWRPS